MLDRNALAQLSQLKKEIIAAKDVADGVVTASPGRYGFVKLDDGRSAFLNPDKMQRVLPGDRVRVNVVKNNQEQLEAELEKLLTPALTRFVGRYKVKGAAHFVMPDGQARWLFLPPRERPRAKENDYVLAELTQHPFADSKATAKGIARIGADGEPYLQHELTIARFGLHRHFSKDAQQQAREVELDTSGEDLTALPFVTIDGETTLDMDDALYIERSDTGYSLKVAIADPARHLNPSSPLAKAARHFANSVYLPGRCLPMLPEQLACELFSLKSGEQRPTLVCELQITTEGAVTASRFFKAQIRSRAKLSYAAVAAHLAGTSAPAGGEIASEVAENLELLHQAMSARGSYRQLHHLVFEDQPDFDYEMDAQGMIAAIHPRPRNSAHRLVEEAMVMTNVAAGELLASAGVGLFTTHVGFRPERLGEVKALLREALGDDHGFDNLDSLEGYLALVRHLRADPAKNPLLAPLKRMLQSAELSLTPAPHFAMGFAHYATVTSPIRRFADLANQWSIHQLIAGEKVQSLPDGLLEPLKESIGQGRQAARQLEQALWIDYLAKHKDFSGEGVIRIVTQQGFGVRMLDSGIEGFVQFGKKTQKNFDAKRMTLTVGDTTYSLDQVVAVKVAGLDPAKRRVKLALLTPPQETAKPAEPAAADATAREGDVPPVEVEVKAEQAQTDVSSDLPADHTESGRTEAGRTEAPAGADTAG